MLNGKWSVWGEFSDCTKPCGTGSKTRTRTCRKCEFGNDCIGSASETIECNLKACPGMYLLLISRIIMIRKREDNIRIDIDEINFSVDYAWNPWTSWSACDKTCGGGIRTKERTKKVEEAHGGDCPGKGTKEQNCSQQKCPGNICDIFFN